ncbi:MAG: hypothetical protein P4L90_05575 [Rhodopila sp.]|nr:hypothetical protein [Rhodopila sp.]
MRHPTDRDNGMFTPREVYVVHAFPVFFAFRVEDRSYQVGAGGRSSGGHWNRIDERIYPVASIAFDAPVNIETALDRVWEWRRFFAQMAMLPLPFEAISVQGSLDDSAPSANLYLPNLKRRAHKVTGFNGLSPHQLALNLWPDREHLGETMREWLSRDAVRRGFRVRLGRVIERMNRRLDPIDLVELGSAVDSLDELATGTSLPADVLNAIVDAAHTAATAAKTDIGRNRVSGLLGTLQRPSLATRFAALGATLSPLIGEEGAALLARSASKIRNASAHGGALNDQIQPRLSSTVEALTALCARFDLETCGVPCRSSSNARTIAPRRFDEGLEQLRRLEA